MALTTGIISRRDLRALLFFFAVLVGVGGWLFYQSGNVVEADPRGCGPQGAECYDLTESTTREPWSAWYAAYGGDIDLYRDIWRSNYRQTVGENGEGYCEVLWGVFGQQRRLHWLNNKSSGDLDALRYYGATLWAVSTRGIELGCEEFSDLQDWYSVPGFYPDFQ